MPPSGCPAPVSSSSFPCSPRSGVWESSVEMLGVMLPAKRHKSSDGDQVSMSSSSLFFTVHPPWVAECLQRAQSTAAPHRLLSPVSQSFLDPCRGPSSSSSPFVYRYSKMSVLTRKKGSNNYYQDTPIICVSPQISYLRSFEHFLIPRAQELELEDHQSRLEQKLREKMLKEGECNHLF